MRVYAEGKSCNGLAKYTLRFQGEWTRERHPNFPSGPHFSPIIGCSHNDGYVMWKAEIKATRGVQSVAETGMLVLQLFSITSLIQNELAHASSEE